MLHAASAEWLTPLGQSPGHLQQMGVPQVYSACLSSSCYKLHAASAGMLASGLTALNMVDQGSTPPPQESRRDLFSCMSCR